MQGMFAAAAAKLPQLDPIRVVTPIFVGCIVAFLAIRAGEMNHLTHIFLCHVCCPLKL
jgi:hypothetical protein